MDNKWNLLKDDIERAVEEGFQRGFNSVPDTADGGKFTAYRYVLDKMNELDEKDGESDERND